MIIIAFYYFSIDETAQDDEMELYDEGFETEGYHSEYVRRRRGSHPKLRIKPSLFSAIEVCVYTYFI